MPAGRHRSFDKSEALESAMEVFWKNGYSGTSLSDLTRAMQINKPSLYAAFGNKESLFISSLDHYLENYGATHSEILLDRNIPLASRLKAYLLSITQMLTNEMLPGGCFITGSTCEAGSDILPQPAIDRLSEINQQTRQSLSDFCSLEIENFQGNLSPEGLADYLMVQQFGLGVMARTGKPIGELTKIIEQIVASLVK